MERYWVHDEFQQLWCPLMYVLMGNEMPHLWPIFPMLPKIRGCPVLLIMVVAWIWWKPKQMEVFQRADESPCLLVAMTAMAFPCMAYFRHIAQLCIQKKGSRLHAHKNTVACQCRDDVKSINHVLLNLGKASSILHKGDSQALGTESSAESTVLLVFGEASGASTLLLHWSKRQVWFDLRSRSWTRFMLRGMQCQCLLVDGGCSCFYWVLHVGNVRSSICYKDCKKMN